MTHEAGIEAAAETLVIEMYPDAPDMQGARHSARLIVEAYLGASGMVLVPRIATDEMINTAFKRIGWVRADDLCRAYMLMISEAPYPFKSKP